MFNFFVTDSKAFVSRCGHLHNVINTISKICFSIFRLFNNFLVRPLHSGQDSFARIRKFVESDDKIRVTWSVSDVVCWECKTLGLWDIGNVGCW